jgi:HlyD family secretion protein
MSRRVLKYAAITMGVLVLALVGMLFPRTSDEEAGQRYLTAAADRGTLDRKVTSTGTLEAVITVDVGSQISGRIQSLHADYNSVVRKGQILAVIDPSNYEAQRDRARAGLETARASLQNAEATILNRRAELVSAEANLELLRVSEATSTRLHSRYENLFREKLVTAQDVEDTRAALEENRARIRQGEAQIEQAQAALASAQAQREQALANIKQAEAELRVAEVNLQYTEIKSPIDGVVIERNVDMGQTVAATLQAPTLFLIANDLTRMRLIAQVDEADLGGISEAAEVEFTVDAFPDRTFVGDVSEIRLGSDSSSSSGTNVVVYNVIVGVANPQMRLRPGMTATVDFTTARETDVLKVPNSAFRFAPSGGSVDPGQVGRAVPTAEFEENESAAVVAVSSVEQYGIEAGPKIRFLTADGARPEWSAVWVLDARGIPETRQVLAGINDGVETAILDGELKEGEAVILREFAATEAVTANSSPLGLRGPR